MMMTTCLMAPAGPVIGVGVAVGVAVGVGVDPGACEPLGVGADVVGFGDGVAVCVGTVVWTGALAPPPPLHAVTAMTATRASHERDMINSKKDRRARFALPLWTTMSRALLPTLPIRTGIPVRLMYRKYRS